MFMFSLFALLRRIPKQTPFLPPSFPPPEISSFWVTSIFIVPSGTKKVLSTPVESIQLGHLLWSPPRQWPWHTYFSPSLLWHSLLPSHLFCSLLPRSFLLMGDASGPGFWSADNSTNHPSFSCLSPQQTPPFLQFSESSLRWLCFLFWLSLSICRGILVCFSFLRCCSLHFSYTECGQIFSFFWLHQTPS